MKWRFSAEDGGVEGSKFCLFSVALPARCVSSVSPIFHFRRHAFCFLPLAAILESPKDHSGNSTKPVTGGMLGSQEQSADYPQAGLTALSRSHDFF
jgi:hypothetical protein